MILLIGVVLVAAIALAYGVIMIFVREDRLSTALQPYDDALANASADDDDEDTGMGGLARTALVQRAVALTEQVAEQRGILSRTEAALERANLPLRAGEALFFYAAVVVVATMLSLVVTGSVILGLIVGLVAALLPGRRRELPRRPPPQGSSWPCCPTRSRCSRARSEPATRSCRASRRSPRRSPSRWASSCAGSSPRPASAARSRRPSTASPSAWPARTSPGPSWPSASSARSVATSPSCCSPWPRPWSSVSASAATSPLSPPRAA